MQTAVHSPPLVRTGFRVLGFLASTLMVSHFIGDRKAVAALTFQETTQGSLSFEGVTGSYGEVGTPFGGSGSFTYSSTPVDGTFYFGVRNGLRYVFVTDPSQISIPFDFSPIKSIQVTASQGYRLVTGVNITIGGLNFSYSRNTLNPGEYSGDVLLFQPPDSDIFPSASGGLANVSSGDPRSQDLWFVTDYWVLGQRSASPSLALRLDKGGSFGGYNYTNQSFPTGDFSGGWQATAVPEPVSLLGTAAALVGGFYLKRRAKASQL